MKTSVVPVVIRALGCVSHNFTKHISSLSTSTVDKFVLQKSALLGSVKIMRRVLKLSGPKLAPKLD